MAVIPFPFDPEWFYDECSTDLWNESNPSCRNWGLEAIKAPSAWYYNDHISNVTIGVIDGGFQIGHEDLDLSFDMVTGNAGQYNRTIENYDHGTHVLGTIAAVPNNGIGITGVTWNRNMCAYRTNFGEYDTDYGLRWLVKEKHAKIVNCSLDFRPLKKNLENAKKAWTNFFKKQSKK